MDLKYEILKVAHYESPRLSSLRKYLLWACKGKSNSTSADNVMRLCQELQDSGHIVVIDCDKRWKIKETLRVGKVHGPTFDIPPDGHVSLTEKGYAEFLRQSNVDGDEPPATCTIPLYRDCRFLAGSEAARNLFTQRDSSIHLLSSRPSQILLNESGGGRLSLYGIEFEVIQNRTEGSYGKVVDLSYDDYVIQLIEDQWANVNSVKFRVDVSINLLELCVLAKMSSLFASFGCESRFNIERAAKSLCGLLSNFDGPHEGTSTSLLNRGLVTPIKHDQSGDRTEGIALYDPLVISSLGYDVLYEYLDALLSREVWTSYIVKCIEVAESCYLYSEKNIDSDLLANFMGKSEWMQVVELVDIGRWALRWYQVKERCQRARISWRAV